MMGRRTALFAMALASAAAWIAVACGIDAVGEMVPLPPRPDTEADRPFIPPPDGAALDVVVVDVDASPAPCPTNVRLPSMVPIGDAGVCIDSTEVTNEQYDQFLRATGGAPDGSMPGPCAAVSSFARSGDPDGGEAGAPASRLTWCHALAYCNWAGKRLCRGPDVTRDAAASDWYAACSDRGARAYPYGATYEAGACWDNYAAYSGQRVASKPGCEGAIPGVFDMTGNVAEWVDSCIAATFTCVVAGGSYGSVSSAGDPTIASCRDMKDWNGLSAHPSIGFRCCADAP